MNDLRYAVRSLRARPAFTAVLVISLALAIGASGGGGGGFGDRGGFFGRGAVEVLALAVLPQRAVLALEAAGPGGPGGRARGAGFFGFFGAVFRFGFRASRNRRPRGLVGHWRGVVTTRGQRYARRVGIDWEQRRT